MNKLTPIVLILTACIGATVSVHAQDASGTVASTPPTQYKLKGFEKEFDADHDGKLNDTEKAAMIAKYDKNGNGKIDKDELPPKKPKQGNHPKDAETNAPTH
ncbi:MAG: EF-hand domain-containing protein [Proteobacteria bacterium]|nr:EF-hand domain-containing protein [Pseudomonadota bacterium]